MSKTDNSIKSNEVKEHEEPVDYEYLAAWVTIYNKSSKTLGKGTYGSSHGKYVITPKATIKTNEQMKYEGAGRSGAWAGYHGWTKYMLGDTGYGSLEFECSCPYKGSNLGKCKNNAIGVNVEVYANNYKDYSWGDDVTNWGTEGQVPTSGHPISILFVVKDDVS